MNGNTYYVMHRRQQRVFLYPPRGRTLDYAFLLPGSNTCELRRRLIDADIDRFRVFVRPVTTGPIFANDSPCISIHRSDDSFVRELVFRFTINVLSGNIRRCNLPHVQPRNAYSVWPTHRAAVIVQLLNTNNARTSIDISFDRPSRNRDIAPRYDIIFLSLYVRWYNAYFPIVCNMHVT